VPARARARLSGRQVRGDVRRAGGRDGHHQLDPREGRGMNLRASLGGTPVLEKYELLEEIGHGGMATVYRSLDKRLGREVAVKIIHKHLRENSEVATRFTAEAR